MIMARVLRPIIKLKSTLVHCKKRLEAWNTYAILRSRTMSTPFRPWEYVNASVEFLFPMVGCDLIRTDDFGLRAVTRTVLSLFCC